MNLNQYIDHTLLKSTACEADIRRLCAEAKEYRFASVCINPCFVSLARQLLEGSGVKVCTVIGFPLGANTAVIKVAETEQAYRDGCDEFDMVIHVGALKAGQDDAVRQEIAQVVRAAQGRCVKVIIETGLLTDEEKVRAVRLACEAGAAFVKTCTGFTEGKATVHDVRLMAEQVTGGVKVKASGGIRTREDALALIEAGASRLGASSGVAIVTGEAR